MLLLLDNYDSFVYNLARYFQRLGQTTEVVRSDAIDAAGVLRLAPDAVVISPGPCTPAEAGCSLEVVRHCTGRLPILGVCLGHQAIGAALGGRVVRAAEPMHGRSSPILHSGRSIFAGIASPTVACRYHSLVVDEQSVPDCLEVTARTADGVIMALAHRQFPVIGLQFHPESILTEAGYQMLANFLHLSGIALPASLPDMTSERDAAPSPYVLPTGPVTF